MQSAASNVRRVELVRSAPTARIHLGGDRINAITVEIENAQKIDRVAAQVRLDQIERVTVTKKELSIERSYPQKRTACGVPS